MAKTPYLPLYYNDLRGATQDWTDEEFGAYVRLLIYQWDRGFIPKQMVRLLKIADSAEKNWPVLSQKFTPDEQGFLQNSVMEKIRIEREKFIDHQVINGRKGGRPPQENPKKTQTLTQIKPKKKPLEGEDEYEDDIEDENFEKSEKLLMPFTSENFRVLWQNWKKYRLQEFKKKYKSIQSEQGALSHLAKISGGNEETAFEVVAQSIGNQWQGLFELKISNHGSSKNGKSGSGKIGGEQLNEAFTKFYKNQ